MIPQSLGCFPVYVEKLLREHVKKTCILSRHVAYKGGLECSETKEYAKIFLQGFAWVSLKNFQAFLVSKTYVFIHVKKNCIKSICLLTASGWALEGVKALADAPLRMQVVFYVLPKYKAD